MDDEWTKVISGDQLVKFTYADLPTGGAFLTAQIAGHDVVLAQSCGGCPARDPAEGPTGYAVAYVEPSDSCLFGGRQ